MLKLNHTPVRPIGMQTTVLLANQIASFKYRNASFANYLKIVIHNYASYIQRILIYKNTGVFWVQISVKYYLSVANEAHNTT